MYDDVIALRDFYHSPLGQHLTGQMQPHIARFWQSGSNSCNVMLGYGLGWLPHKNSATSIPTNLLSLMLARSGVIAWPTSGACRSSLVSGHELPLPDVHVDRLLLAHALEFDPQPGHLLDECWRVLDGAGKILVAAPNRRGLWAGAQNLNRQACRRDSAAHFHGHFWSCR